MGKGRWARAVLAGVAVSLAFVRPAGAVKDGAGITISNGVVATQSDEANFLASSSNLSCSSSTGMMLVDTTAGTLSWCNSSATKQAAFGNDSGQAAALNTGDGSDGSRGITLKDNVSTPVPTPAAGYTVLHTKDGTLYQLVNGGTAPGGRVAPEVKVMTSATSALSAKSDITGLTGFTIVAGATYLIDASIQVALSSAAADPQVYLVLDTTTGCSARLTGAFSFVGSGTSMSSQTTTTLNTGYIEGTTGSAANNQLINMSGTIRGCSTTTSAKLQIAPQTLTTTNVTVQSDGWMRVTQVQ